MEITTLENGQRMTQASWDDLLVHTIAANECPSLFESVAKMAERTDDDEEFETEDSVAVSAYSSPLALWEMKTGQYVHKPRSGRSLWSHMKWSVIRAVSEQEGWITKRPDGVFIHPQIDVMSSRLDTLASCDEGKSYIPLIGYNVPARMVDTWRNAIGEWVAPEYVEITAHHHMAVTGAASCIVIALIGGTSTRIFEIERDEELIEEVEGAVQDFWKTVESRTQPQPDLKRDAKVMARLYSKINPKTEVVDMRNDRDFLKLIERKELLSKQMNKIKKELDEAKAEMTQRMNGVGAAIISDTKQISWITVADKEVPAQVKPGYSYLKSRKLTDKCAGMLAEDLIEN